MKMKTKVNIWGVLVAASFTASVALAQSSIADDELLKMLNSAATSEVGVAVVEADVQPEVVLEEVEAIEVVSEEAADAEVVLEEVEAIEVVSEEAADAAVVLEEVEETSEEVAGAVSLEEILAEAGVKDADPVEEGEVDDLGMAALEGGVADTSGDLISVRLNKVGLEEAISLFAQLSGANIIVPELTEAAKISVNLVDVEWRPALQSILDAYNYELYQKVAGSNVFSVRRRPVGAPEPQVVETFKLKYATVPNVAKLLRDLLPADAKISEFASRNMIVVKSSESSLGEVRSVLATIDIVRQQVFIESKFMELSDGTQLDLGIDWEQLGLDEQGAGGLGASVGASQQTYADGRQVTDGAFPGAGLAPIPSFSEHIFTSVLDVDQFKLVLNALATERGVSVVSNPKIIVANEENANISIITMEPNLKQDRKAAMNDTDDTVTFTLDPDKPFFEYGITLDVTPSINTSSNVTVSIQPSLTRKVDQKVVGKGDAQLSYPFITKKTVKTVFNLASGQTAAIGGLTEVSDRIETRKVPLLGSIPLLGRLFSWKQTISGQTETIIFVTVGLANTQDIDLQDSLPEDSELARRRLIRDRNKKALRELGRKYYEIEDKDSLDDSMKELEIGENKRVAKRAKDTQMISN